MSEKSVWLTYAWVDNNDGDVDYIAQELMRAGLKVKLDRWNLIAGRRLWEQIEKDITDPSQSDGWLLYATQASLGSEACKEEYAYALDRALNTRGGDFPVIALFPAQINTDLLPAGIRTRLFVSLTDPNWKERVVSSVEKRQSKLTIPDIAPYDLQIHELHDDRHDNRHAIEVRPRAGTWSPFIAGIPGDEKEDVSPRLRHGPSGHVPRTSILYGAGESMSGDGKLWMVNASNQATPTLSYYIFCKKLPSTLIFGVNGGPPQYTVSLPS